MKKLSRDQSKNING